ncbi:MAG: Hint domain-containing protein [Rhodobacteraceae bacterium]|nr:Hint domain-containing protein [Paracoccaceae bacterium]
MARISEIHFANVLASDTGIAEFVEIALTPAEFAARGDFAVAFYDVVATGDPAATVGRVVTLDDPGVSHVYDAEAGEYVLLISQDVFPDVLIGAYDTIGPTGQYEGVALVDTAQGQVVRFLDFGDVSDPRKTTPLLASDGPAAGAVSSNVPISGQASLQWPSNSPDSVVYAAPTPLDGGPVCFAAGTMIAALHGPVPVEALRPGDLVLTRDRGYRPVRWAGTRHISPARLAAAERLRPVTLAPGALGPGMPARVLSVSPQHRMLLAGPEIAARFGAPEVLAAAKHLVSLPGIAPAPPERGVTYHHLLFDAHEVVLAEGAWSESLFTGPMAMTMMPAAQRAEIFTLFPRLASPGAPAHAAPARRFLNGREARALVAALRGAQPGPALAALPFVPIAPMSEEAAACAGAPDA